MDTVTSTSLLQGLADQGNRRVWKGFCDRYEPVLVSFGRRLGLSVEDARDAAQDTLFAFATAYREGKYDRGKGRLRTWLLTIARNKVIDMQRRHVKGTGRGQLAECSDLLEAVPDDKTISQLWESEWQRAVVKQCLEEVRQEVEPTTMRAFELVVLEEWSPDKVAAHLGTSRNNVYLAKSRVLSRLRQIQNQMEEIW